MIAWQGVNAEEVENESSYCFPRHYLQDYYKNTTLWYNHYHSNFHQPIPKPVSVCMHA